jgi:hypothetical protein
VLQGIVGQLLLSLAAVDTPTRLVAKPLGLIELEDPVGYRVVVTGRFLQAPRPQDQDVHTGKVDRPESGGTWPTEQRAGQGIHLLRREPEFGGQPHGVCQGVDPEAVGDEARGIADEEGASSQALLQETDEAEKAFPFSLWEGCHLAEEQCTRWIEEMGDEEPISPGAEFVR